MAGADPHAAGEADAEEIRRRVAGVAVALRKRIMDVLKAIIGYAVFRVNQDIHPIYRPRMNYEIADETDGDRLRIALKIVVEVDRRAIEEAIKYGMQELRG